MSDSFRTHYSNLQIAENASDEVIKGAYKYLTQKYHPDKNPDNEESKKILQIISRAYTVLSNPETRRQHDDWIKIQRTTQRHTKPEPDVEREVEAEVEAENKYSQQDYVVNDWSKKDWNEKKEKPFNWENNSGDIFVIGVIILVILYEIFDYINQFI